MEFQHKKHVRIVVDLEVGDKVTVEGYAKALDGKEFTVEGIANRMGNCGSGIMVKISGHDRWLDSDWLTKVPQSEDQEYLLH